MPPRPREVARLERLIQRRARLLEPEMARAIERGFDQVRELFTAAELAAVIRSEGAEALAATFFSEQDLDRALAGVRAQIAGAVQQSTTYFLGQLGVTTVGAGFGQLDPNVLAAIRVLDTKVMQGLKQQVRETFRAVVTEGLREGTPTATIARRARASLGLAPSQLKAVRSFEQALKEGPPSRILRFGLRDRRFDPTIRRLAKGGGLTAAQVRTMKAAYQRRMIAHNAKIQARTAVNDALRAGKHLSTQQAIEAGHLPGDRMLSMWSSSGDSRVREEHANLDGEIVPYGEPFSNGDVIPGASEYNCRCIKVDFVGGPSEVAEAASGSLRHQLIEAMEGA